MLFSFLDDGAMSPARGYNPNNAEKKKKNYSKKYFAAETAIMFASARYNIAIKHI